MLAALMKGDYIMDSVTVYSDFSLLKNIGFDIEDKDALYNFALNNPKNRADYNDFEQRMYWVVDDSEINKIFIPAYEDGIDSSVCGLMYETTHYSRFVNKDYIKFFYTALFGILRLGRKGARDKGDSDLAVNVVNAPFVDYIPRDAEIECQLYAVPVRLQYFTTDYEAKHSHICKDMQEDSIDSMGEYADGNYLACDCEQRDNIDGTAIIYARVINKELRKNKLTGSSYVYMELDCDGLHVDLLVDPQQLPLPLEKITYVKGVILLYANVKQENFEAKGYNKKISLERPMDIENFNEQIAVFIKAMRNLQDEFLIVEFVTGFKHGLGYIQAVRNSYVSGEKPSYEVEVSLKKDTGKWHGQQMFAIRDKTVDAKTTTAIFRRLCVEENLLDLSSWTDITEEVFGESWDEYCSKNSIYVNLGLNIKRGKLRKDYELPAYGKEKLFADGAQDGVALYHMARPQTDCKEQLLAAFKCLDKGDFAAAEEKLAVILEKNMALAIADDICNVILANKDVLYPGNVYRFIPWVIRKTKNKELIKVVLVMSELFGMDEALKNVVRMLGQCEEFTLFVIYAMQHWENGNEEIFQLGKLVHDWGRIHAIDYLDAETEEIKDWLIEEGLNDIFMPAYAALTVFKKADVRTVLAEKQVPYGRFHGCLKILSSLLDEGPVLGISEVADAEVLFKQILLHAHKHNLLESDLNLLYDIMRWCEGKEETVYAELGAEIMQLLQRPEYVQLVKNAVKNGECLSIAETLGIPFKEDVFELLKKDFENQYHKCFWLVSAEENDDKAIEKVVELFCDRLPFEQIATGAAMEHGLGKKFKYCHMLDMAMEILPDHPVGRAAELLAAAIQCPVIRTRNFAIKIIKSWVQNASIPLCELDPELYHILVKAKTAEVRNDISHSIQDILAGRIDFDAENS